MKSYVIRLLFHVCFFFGIIISKQTDNNCYQSFLMLTDEDRLEKQKYIDNNINELFKQWLSLVTVWGSIIFTFLSVMDYFVTPENFKSFFYVRISTALFLLLIYLLTKIITNRGFLFYQILAYMVIIGSALGIEYIIIRFGGHTSSYYVGIILLGILVIGFIPARFSFNVTSAFLIYGIYLFPILFTEKIADFRMFLTANAFICASFTVILLLRYLNLKSLVNELGLKYELEKHQNRLKTLVKHRTAELSGAVNQLTSEVAERERAEEKIKSHIERHKAMHTIDKAITATRELQNILDILLVEVIEKLKVDAADVLLLNNDTMTLEYAAHKGFKTERIKKINLSVGQGCAGNVVLDCKKIIIPDISTAEEKFITTAEYKFSQALLIRNEGFRSYFGIPLVAKGYIKGVLEIFHRSPHYPDEEWLDFLDALASQAAIALDNVSMFESLEMSKEEVLKSYDMTIESLARALDYRDRSTKGHSSRVTEMTLRIAKVMGISDAELVHVRRGAFLHDIGKLSVPDSILFKAGPLTDEEWLINKMHPLIAYEMLSSIKFLNPAIDIPYCHHERWDGTGYPRGLKGEEIPLVARIFSLVDIWDALSSKRPYRHAWSEEKVLKHIRQIAGSHLDPKVVETFLFMQDTLSGQSQTEEPDNRESFYRDEFLKFYEEN
jgi:HD-GYP domain-containing protein (c-di-GMP phosphodiesterase class II)